MPLVAIYYRKEIPMAVIQEVIEKHDELNPKIWDKSGNLLPDVREKLLEIVEYFKDTVEVPLSIADVQIVGSNASYNYTDGSDLDLHIIANFDTVDCNKEILQALYNAEKTAFNKAYDISIHGIGVEVYVQDIRSTTVSNGIYSLIADRWLKKPIKLDNIQSYDVSREFHKWREKISTAIESGDYSLMEKALNDIYFVRKNSIDIDGEYGKGNQLFKEVRSAGLIDELKDAMRNAKSKQLSVESLTEASRMDLINKSKRSVKGEQRFKRRLKSRVASSVREFNRIDMNKLFKDDILSVDVSVIGETDTYTVKISFGGFLRLLRDEIDNGGKFDTRSVTRALLNGFNRDDVYIHCTCPDSYYRFSYQNTRNNVNSGEPQNIPAPIRNPFDTLGSTCKHTLLVLSNNSWLLKVSSVIVNYVRYMERHYERMYADVIYPAIYGKKYEKPVQLDITDIGDIDTTSAIDTANIEARKRGQFQKGNQPRFVPARTSNSQQTLFDDSGLDDEEL